MTVPIIVAVTITIFVLGVGGMMTTVGALYRDLRKPAWNAPDWVFGPAWTVILASPGVLAWFQSSEAGVRQHFE